MIAAVLVVWKRVYVHPGESSAFYRWIHCKRNVTQLEWRQETGTLILEREHGEAGGLFAIYKWKHVNIASIYHT